MLTGSRMLSLLKSIFTVAVLCASFFGASSTFATNSFNPEQTQAIEGIVRSYLLNNPEILLQVSRKLQQKASKMQKQKVQQAVVDNAAQLFSDADSPVVGNPKGSITLVEFFDYRCGHCRNMLPVLEKFVRNNRNVRIVYKEFPIFGPKSEMAAKAALAANAQGKFFAMHKALMQSPKANTPEDILKLAKKAGLNIARFQEDLKNKDALFAQQINDNYRLANSMHIQATPAYIVSNPSLPATTQSQKGKKAFFLLGEIRPDVLAKLVMDLQ